MGITCGNRNVRLVDAVISFVGGRLAREEYGLVVMSPDTRADGDVEDCLLDVLTTPDVHNVLSCDFETGAWALYRRLEDKSWRRDRLDGHDWSLDLSGFRGTVKGRDLDNEGQYLDEGLSMGR